MSFFQVLEQKTPYSPRPFRIIEIFCTSDGLRSRIIGAAYETIEQALEDVQQRKNKQKDSKAVTNA